MKKLTFAFIFLILLCSCNSENKKRLPNIILIVADDLGYADIGIANLTSDAKTPNIDRIAKSGYRFTNAYDNSPICNQSRTGIITGCYPQKLGSYWYFSNGLHDKKYVTIPELLKKKNYKTGYIGKIHYGKDDSDSSSRSFPTNHGFDYFFGHTSARKHYMNHVQEMEASFLKTKKTHNRLVNQSLEQGSLWRNNKKVDTITFLTKLLGKESINFIRKNSAKPFFLQVAFNAAHNFTHQLPEEYLNANNLKGYHDWDPETEDYYEWYEKGRYPNNEEGRAHFLGQVKYMDEQIGLILDELKEKKILDNTLIFFISDNGGSTPIYANNYPLRGSKYLLYEGGIRVQLLVAFPKKYKAGKVIDNMVSAMDILPTICQEVGITIPKHIDGIDLGPILSEKNTDLEHDVLFWDTGHELAVRKGSWKLRKAFTKDHVKYEMVDVELGEYLYNLEKDVEEQNNLLNSESPIAKELEGLYKDWKKEVNNLNKKYRK